MILDLDQLDANTASLTCDVCIVGGGAVGLALSMSLADAGVDVLVLEGGGQSLEMRSQALHRGESIGHPFPNIDVGRYRVLGGTTTYWGGQVLPFDAFVMSERAWLGHAAWPIDASQLRPYFAPAYALLGIGGAEFDDSKVWRRVGITQPALGDGVQMVMTRWLKTRNFSKLFAKRLRAAGGPRILTHANVVGIRLDEAPAVKSVTARSLGGRTIEVTARRFVLANGALEISRLLMHPLADQQEAPWQASPFLGRPLIDHLDCVVGDVEILDHARFRQLFDNIFIDGYKYTPKLRMAPSTQQADETLDVVATFGYKTRFSEHLEYLKLFLRSLIEGGSRVSFTALPKHVMAVAATSVPLAVRYFKDKRSFKPRDAEVSLGLTCEQWPSEASRLLLSDQTDELGMRRLRVDWRIDGRELKSMRRFGLLIKEQLEGAGLARVTLKPKLLELDPSFVAEIHDGVHQMGTTRMGRSPQEGFVDSELKVFGISNLYVAGAAVFPSTGFANPTFTAIALALRLADHLKASLR